MTRRTRRQRKKTDPAGPAMARAETAMLAGDTGAAIDILTGVVKSQPKNFHALSNLGALQMEQGNTGAAEAAFSKALEIEPGSAVVLSNLAALANQTGDRQGALTYYRRALEAAPEDAEIWHDLARSKKFSADDPDLGAIAHLAQRDGLDDAATMYLSFALAKAHEDIGEWDAAFRHMAAANRLKWQATVFDLNREQRAAERITEVFDQRFFADRMGTGTADDLPVFVLGMPRSGTTLVEQVLASHAQVHGGGELDDLPAVVAPVIPKFPEAAAGVDGGQWKALGDAYVARLRARDPAASRITDKMPRNFYFAGLIGVALPNARIIHCRRSAMDTCLSCFTLHFPYGQEFTYDLETLGGYYRIYRRLMDHWRRVLPGRVLDVDYEKLVADPEPETRRILEFCGLSWDPDCLEFHQSRRQVSTASATQVREPMHGRSVGRWRRFAAHLGPLRDALGPYADEPGGD